VHRRPFLWNELIHVCKSLRMDELTWLLWVATVTYNRADMTLD